MGSQYLLEELRRVPLDKVRKTAKKLGLGDDASSATEIVHALAEIRDWQQWAYMERRLCEELVIPTQEERRIQAAVDTATAAAESARAAKRSASTSIVATMVAAVSAIAAVYCAFGE